MSEDELKSFRDKSYRIEIPLVLEKELGRLKDGRMTFRVTVKNSTEGDELSKVVEFRLKS